MSNLSRKLMMCAAGSGGEVLGVEDVFSTWLYAGTDPTNNVINNGIDLSTKGGLIWVKARGSTGQNYLVDTARGADKRLFSNLTNGQSTELSFVFNANGFTVPGNDGNINALNATYASWTFRKAPKFFDVVTYTGTDGGASQVISHSLGSTPGVVIIKRTSGSEGSASGWGVYHTSVGLSAGLLLNSTSNASFACPLDAVSSSTFTVDPQYNGLGDTYVAYLFAHDAGGFGDSGDESVIKCGVYSGSPPIDLGWEPQWVLIKPASTSGTDWYVFDNMRGLFAGSGARSLNPNLSAAEVASGSFRITSTGFVDDWLGYNDTIYIAIRRGPMKTPTDATKVFAMDTRGGTAPTPPAFNAPFPVDFGLYTGTGAGTNWLIGDRLRGPVGLIPNLSNLEFADPSFRFDYQNGWWDNSSVVPSYPGWMFRRAPGFFDVVASNAYSATQPHSLGVPPELIISKDRGQTSNWGGAVKIGNEIRHFSVDLTNSFYDSGSPLNTYTSTTFHASSAAITALGSLPSSGTGNIYYLFATCPGVSKVGSYTGTGTTLDIDCGFTAGSRLVLIKRTDSTGDWYVWDTARGIVSGNDPYLLLNSTAAEVTNTDYIDPLASGFQITSTAPAAINASGGSYIFLAIA